MLQLTEGYGYMPTLIGVCNEDGAALGCDSRMTTVVDDKAEFIDDCRRIFKVNDNLLYGVAGMFSTDASLVEPLAGKDCSKLNVAAAMKIVEDYLLEQKSVGTLRECRYVLAGKDRDGHMCIAQVRYDEESDTIYTDRQYSRDQDVIWMSLPPAAAIEYDKWQARLTEILEADSGAAIGDRLCEYITELSEVSSFVGGEILTRVVITDKS